MTSRTEEKILEFRVFTDGSCQGNPGPGGWGAVISLPGGQVRELAGSHPATTNNRMELLAPTRALETIYHYYNENLKSHTGPPPEIRIFTDSKYVVRGITEWVHNWSRRGWIKADGKPVENQDLWKNLHHWDQEVCTLGSETGGVKVHWRHVAGHAGIPGNERADELSVAGERASLYEGPLDEYPFDLQVVESDLPVTKSSRTSGKKGGKKTYLSLVKGELKRHLSWGECENRVKGAPNARYRKCSSPMEEEQVVRQWGVYDLYKKLET